MAQVTLEQAQQNALDDLDDPNGNYWQLNSLTRWINDACSDIAKQAECLLETDQIPTVAAVGTAIAATTNDIIRFHRVEWTPDGVQVYPLEIRNINEMDAIWGIYQNIQSAWPTWVAPWQSPPLLKLQFYPVPAQNGTMRFWYYRNAIPVVNPGDFLDTPAAYEPCARRYVKYMALRRAGDPRWSEEYQLYQDEIATLITNTRSYNDSSGQISPQWGGMGGYSNYELLG